MKKIHFSLMLFLVLNLCVLNSHAELFKWVDSNGKIHYSDKKPKDKVEMKVVPVKRSTAGEFVQETTGKAILRPYEKTARKIYLLDTLYSWKKESESSKNKKIGVYYVGKSCSSRGAMKVPDVYINHKGFFPKESSLSKRMIKVINGLDYDSARSSKYDLLKKLKRSGGLSLHSEITELDFNSCAPNTSKRDRLKPVSKISSYQFKKHRIKLKIHWQLKSNRDQNVIYEVTTDGSFNGWNSESSASEALGSAVESATLKLYSDKNFISKIMVDEEGSGLDKASSSIPQPIKMSEKTNPHRLFLSVNEKVWARQFSKKDVVGGFLFGDQCAAKKPMLLMDAINNQQWLFASNGESSNSVIKAISSLGYPIQKTIEDALSEIEKSNGYTLLAEIVGINYEVCAPSLSASTKYKTMDDIKRNKLTRKQVKVTIKWSLKTDRNRVLLYQSRTEGLAGSLLVDSSGTAVMQQAIANASLQLLSDPRFIDKIAIKNKKVKAMKSFPVNKVKPGSGIVRPENGEAKQILLVTNNNAWKDLLADKHSGYYASGKKCSPFKTKSWPGALNEYSGFYPTVVEMAGSMSKILKSLDYKHKRVDQYNVVRVIRKTGAYSLHSNILELRFDSCAPEIQQNFVSNKKRKISARSFKRHRVSMKIKWQLLNESNQTVLYEATTQGVSDSWLLNAKPEKIMSQAIENATTALFSDQRLIDKIIVSEKEEEGFFAKLFSSANSDEEPSTAITNSYVLKAHLAQTFADITPIKIMVVEYYQNSGKWPDSLDEIGLSDYSNSKTVSDISIEYDGSILVELEAMFGNNKMFKLSPTEPSSENAFNIRWECYSNLAKKQLPTNCETL